MKEPSATPRQNRLAELRLVYRQMSRPRRRQFHILAGLMLVGAVAEFATIGAVFPLLAIISDPTIMDRSDVARVILTAFGAETRWESLAAVTAVFALIVTASGLIRFQLARSLQDFAFGLSNEFVLDIQGRFLAQPYAFHAERNTSSLIAALDKVEVLVFNVVIPLMQAGIAAVLSIFIIGALLAIDPVTALVAGVIFSTIYFALTALTRGRLARNSDVIAAGYGERLKIVQESLGGIRDVIIDGSQPTYLALLERENFKLGRARADTAVIAAAPRFLIETIGIVAIAAITLFASQRDGGFTGALPILGALALGAQRLLPLAQQIYSGWTTAAGHFAVVGETVELLSLPVEDVKSNSAPALPFEQRIRLRDVGFAYRKGQQPTLSEISLDIPKGSSLALVGETGSGKSTLADLLMGLLETDEGQVLIDDSPLTAGNRRRWQRNIAHVPQTIFLADASIASNIALGVNPESPETDRVIEAAKRAQLDDFVKSLPEGYATVVGERGIRLSGGQRQRLGIARALYKQAPVLVLDEATSALDDETEAAVMDSLYALGDEGRTVIVIAHRLSTIARCDRVARLSNGRLVEVSDARAAVAARK